MRRYPLRLPWLKSSSPPEDPYAIPKEPQRGPWRPPPFKHPPSRPAPRFTPNEIVFGPAGSGEDDPAPDPPQRDWSGWNMNDMWRRATRPAKWTKPKW